MIAGFVIIFYALVCMVLVLLRWIDPPTTAVQLERHIESRLRRKPYRKLYTFVPIGQIASPLQHAVVSAEDARFFQHHGFDWTQVQIAVQDDLDGGKSRGASTITQQLVKNLFLSTGRSFIRKGIEFTIVPLTEMLLSKKRILELYLNVIEWGPGVYGAEASSRYYFHVPASRITREQAIELASILPAPLRRKPGRMTAYDVIISSRMAQMGW
ncbi:MAG TPA: monofunctional biosynthetic peptidoglycan transglycosylase [Bryobacteraceae bacterium]|nr:monofunctional biosynthetic peptidoglycan transglycosylase [Bryobacteraceae bacterium]